MSTVNESNLRRNMAFYSCNLTKSVSQNSVHLHSNSGFMLPSSVKSQIQHNNIMSVKKNFSTLY